MVAILQYFKFYVWGLNQTFRKWSFLEKLLLEAYCEIAKKVIVGMGIGSGGMLCYTRSCKELKTGTRFGMYC